MKDSRKEGRKHVGSREARTVMQCEVKTYFILFKHLIACGNFNLLHLLHQTLSHSSSVSFKLLVL